jgi:hypothetical protein
MSPLGLAIPPRCLAAPTRLSNNATRVRLSDSGYGSRESQSDRLLPVGASPLLGTAVALTDMSAWVKTGSIGASTLCQLYPTKQTSTVATATSASCHHRKCSGLFDHLVGAAEQR